MVLVPHPPKSAPPLLSMRVIPPLVVSFLLPSLPLAAATAPARENFEKHCTDCHGEDGKAQTRLGRKSGAKDLTDKARMAKLTDEEIFKTIKFGRKNKQGEEKMDAFKDGLSDQEITELVAFVRTLAR